MLGQLLATAAILAALGGSAFAQNAAGGTDETPPAQSDAAGAPSAPAADSGARGDAPAPDKVTGKTQGGGVSATAKEVIPTMPQGGEVADAPAGADEDTAALSGETRSPAGADSSKSVSPETMREIREMALAAEKAAATPTPKQSDEEVAAEKKAIERHRDGLFARVEEEEKR